MASSRKPKDASRQHERRKYYQEMGQRVSELRRKHDMTQAELARALRVSQQTVFAYELGDRRISALTLDKIAGLFEVSADVLMGRKEAPPVKKSPVSLRAMRVAKRLAALPKTEQIFIEKQIARAAASAG